MLYFSVKLCFTGVMLESIISKYKSKAAFCRDIGISQQFLTQLENGKRRWPPKAVLVLQSKHGIEPSLLRPDIFVHQEPKPLTTPPHEQPRQPQHP